MRATSGVFLHSPEVAAGRAVMVEKNAESKQISSVTKMVNDYFLYLQCCQEEQKCSVGEDRYLLCACQRGNTSSVDNTGTGFCGAGQSDTLCLTCRANMSNKKIQIIYQHERLSCNNF